MSLPRQQTQNRNPDLSRRDLLLGRREALSARPPAGERKPTPEQAVAHVGPGCFMAQGITCRLCEDSCDTGAFRFRPQLGGKALVSVETASCTGCADCIDICPAGAITLVAAPAATTAECQTNKSRTCHGR